jgi:hypothetical protein
VEFKTRLLPAVLIGGLVLAGGGSVIAASGGSSSNGSSAKEQYCPPNSPQGGQPQGGPGNNCGNPPDKCPNGDPKPPSGNCGNGNGNPPDKCPNGNPKPPGGNCGNGNGDGHKPGGPAEKPKKHARFTVARKPAKQCYTRRFTLTVKVAHRGKGRKTTVYRDGHRVKRSGRSAFAVTVKVGKLKRGVHRLVLKVRGEDGKLHSRTVTFRRC